jgi:uncharacterized damage-inducible protein DinB
VDAVDILTDAFGRLPDLVTAAVRDLSPDQLTFRIDPGANTIAWLIWHLTRVQDDHIAEVMGVEQLWTAEGWAIRFGLPFDIAATGYGQSPAEVGAVRVSDPALLTAYYDAVHARTIKYIAGLQESDLDRIVDPRWDPPVTLGVRLVSVAADDLEHVGQAALVRGVILRRQRPAGARSPCARCESAETT